MRRRLPTGQADVWTEAGYACDTLRALRFPVALLTREYPPEVYGGAGVHVEYLARELARLVDLDRPLLRRATPDRRRAPGSRARELGRARRRIEHTPTRSRRCPSTSRWPERSAGAALVHSHTWYAQLGGHLAKLLHGIPHVATVHSLEPLRPWKAEQLGGGYALSSFCERTGLEGADAIIAVSNEMRRDVLTAYPTVAPTRVHVIHNGIDTEEYQPDPRTDVLERHGIDPTRPVGRLRRARDAAEGPRPPPGCRAGDRPVGTDRALRRRARHAGARRARSPRSWTMSRARARLAHPDRGDAAEARPDPDPLPRHRVRLPVDLRAARDREPRGDGLRDGGRRHPDGGHPRGRRGRRDRPPRAVRGRRRRSRASLPTRRPSPPRSPSGSTPSSPTPTSRAAWGRRTRARRRALLVG